MEYSIGCMHLLRELANANVATRKLLLRHMTSGQMEALGEVV